MKWNQFWVKILDENNIQTNIGRKLGGLQAIKPPKHKLQNRKSNFPRRPRCEPTAPPTSERVCCVLVASFPSCTLSGNQTERTDRAHVNAFRKRKMHVPSLIVKPAESLRRRFCFPAFGEAEMSRRSHGQRQREGWIAETKMARS